MSNLGINNEIIYEYFSIVNDAGSLIENVPPSAFSFDLFEPNGSKSILSININELSGGHYRASFIPNKVGIWYLTIYHDIYFPWGKSGEIQIYSSDFTSLQTNISEVLGLVHSNIFIDNPIYDTDNNLTSARIRIYSNSDSIGTNNDVINSYQITAVGDGAGKFITWKQARL